MTLEVWVPGEFPFDDVESAEGLRKVNEIFKLRPIQGRVKALNPSQEVSPMSEQISGIVESKKVDGNRHAFKVSGKWVSCFVPEDAPEEAVEALKAVAEGDDVVFEVVENKGYLNIENLVEHKKGDPSRVPKTGGYSFKKTGSGTGSGGGSRSNWKPEDKRPSLVSFALSYGKDILNKLLEGDDMKTTSPEGQVKFVLDTLPILAEAILDWELKKVKELGYQFPKAE